MLRVTKICRMRKRIHVRKLLPFGSNSTMRKIGTQRFRLLWKRRLLVKGKKSINIKLTLKRNAPGPKRLSRIFAASRPQTTPCVMK